jgi:hypothetical protein
MDEVKSEGKAEIHDFCGCVDDGSFKNGEYQPYNEGKIFNFLTAGQKAATFSFRDILSLAKIEQMTGYKVKPRGVLSQFKHGGFVLSEKNGQGLVVAITDLENMDWTTAKDACDDLILNGYSDWHLPTIEQLNAIFKYDRDWDIITNDDSTAVVVNFLRLGIGGFKGGGTYWSSNEYSDKKYAMTYEIYSQGPSYQKKEYLLFVRPVRIFSVLPSKAKKTSTKKSKPGL